MRTNLIKKKEKTEKKELPSSDGKLDMVIAFDTTGSMCNYIDSVRRYVTDLIPKLFKQNPNLRLSIVSFGDYCDMIDKDKFGNAYQVINLTNNEESLIDFVKKAPTTYGGDSDEFYELVIKKIVEETNWRKDSTKAVLLIADACPHGIGYTYYGRVANNKINWKEEAWKAAKKGIKFDTLSIGNHQWFRELSEITRGVHAPFCNSDKTSQLVEAAALARGGEATKAIYYATMDSFKHDSEMTAVYKAYSKELY